MNLLIVESPTKAKTLNRFLGSEYKVAASMGHVRDLPGNKMNIDTKHDFEPTYEVAEDKQKVIKELCSLARKAKMVYLAMDPDREGEAIAWHVRHVIKDKLGEKAKKDFFKRISFHQITKAAVEEAIGNAGGVNLQLVDAQQARRVLDRLVGYSLSPILWRKVRRGLSAGRVQSVALRLVVEREREIAAFKPQELWEIAIEVTKDKKEEAFWVSLVEVGGKAVVEGKGDNRKFLINSKEKAMPIVADLKKAGYEVESVEKKERKSYPKPPYTTSTLQQAAANSLGWTAKRTMSVAQQLYEKGLITYHRTDSFHLAPEAVTAVRELIPAKYGAEYLPDKANFYKTSSKSAQEAHEAIRPTDVVVEPAMVDGDVDGAGKKLYSLVWKRFVSCQMMAAVYDATTINVEAKQPNSKTAKYRLRASGAVIKFAGWRIVYGRSIKSQAPSTKQIQNSNGQNSKQEESDVVLPEVQQGEALKYVDLASQQKFTEPPPRYNDASLVKTLEKLGIGRPSTYAPTIGTLMARGYMERTERKFFPTAVGMTVTDFLADNFKEIMDYGFTAGMEDLLDKIAEGKREWVPVIREFWGPFNSKVKDVGENAKRVKVPVEKLGKKCPECKEGELVIRTGRFGKFISCSRFPDCRYTAKLENKVKGIKCPKCGEGDVVIKKTRKGRTFFGCNKYPECDWASWTDPRKESVSGKTKKKLTRTRKVKK